MTIGGKSNSNFKNIKQKIIEDIKVLRKNNIPPFQSNFIEKYYKN